VYTYEIFMYPDIVGITLDIILIPLITYETFRTCTRWQKKMGNNLEKVSNVQKANQRGVQEGRAEMLC